MCVFTISGSWLRDDQALKWQPAARCKLLALLYIVMGICRVKSLFVSLGSVLLCKMLINFAEKRQLVMNLHRLEKKGKKPLDKIRG